MLASAVVMFREVLEAALIIAIVLGASRGIAGRGKWVAGGIGMGFLGAAIVAAVMDIASTSLIGNAQSILDAVILLCAVVMLTWHNVWMNSHGKQLAKELKEIGQEVCCGNRPLAALMVVTMVAVMREGSEAVLFLWAIASSGEQSLHMVLGGIGGLVAGALVGVFLYFGLLRIPVKHFFSVTSWLILFLSAGLAAQAAGFLNQLGLLPALGYGVWNTSEFLSQSSMTGQLLHILIGYVANPSGIQIVFYAGTLLTTLVLMHLFGRSRNVPSVDRQEHQAISAS